jgi:replicative DNA helicase
MLKVSPETRWQLELLSWLVDDQAWLDHPAIPEDCLDREFRAAIDAMRRARGTGPRWLQAAEMLAGEGKTGAASLLDQAVRMYPPRPLDQVVEAVRAIGELRRLHEAAQKVLKIRAGTDPVLSARSARALLASAMVKASGPDRSRTAAEVGIGMLGGNQDPLCVPSGIDLVDRLLGGWRPGDLVLVLGLTGTGKTSLLVQSAAAAAHAGFWAHIVSAEMSAEDLVPRLLGDHLAQYVDDEGAPVTVDRVVARDPKVMGVFGAVLSMHEERMSRVTIDDRTWQRASDMLVAICQHQLRRPTGVLFVDYLQLIHPDTLNSPQSREQQVREVAESLKRLADQFRIPVVVAAQLVDPPPWTREYQRSATPAVRESRAAAHAADLVLELERGGESTGRYVPYRLRILKARHSPHTGAEQVLGFDRWSCRFTLPPSGEQRRPLLY